MILSRGTWDTQLKQRVVAQPWEATSFFVHVLMEVRFVRILEVNERVKVKGSTSSEGFKVDLPNLFFTFVLHECGVLYWENRKK